MKKTIIFITVIFAAMVLAGCMGMDNSNSTGNNMQNATDNIKENAQQTTDKAKEEIKQATDTVTDPVKEAVDESQFIGEEKAKQKALERAGLTNDGIMFEKIDLDYENGVWEYEVDFRHAGYEYDVDVNAKTGEIIKFDKESDD